MTVEETNKVDIVSMYPGGKNVYLSVVDHLPWTGDQGGALDLMEHLYLLQEKINAYLSYIDSGDLVRDFPEAVGKKVVILVHHKYDVPHEALIVIDKMRSFLEEHEIGFDLVGGDRIPGDDSVFKR